MLNSYDLVVSALRVLRQPLSKAARYATLVHAFHGVADVDNHTIRVCCPSLLMPSMTVMTCATSVGLASSSTGWPAKNKK